MKEIVIQTPKGERKIGPGNPVFIVAEMSANHNQNLDKAFSIIDSAAKAGADAVKLQTYTPDGMTIESDKEWFRVGGGSNPYSWESETLYSLYQKAFTPREWHPLLKKKAEEMGLVFFSTPFSLEDVDFLESLDMPMYKIASYEVTDIPLLKRIAQTRKPVIMSIGFASLEEVELALQTLKQNGSTQIAVLHCVTAYQKNPRPEQTNLQTMVDIRDRFGVVTGFSDNNAGNEIPLQAAIMGASIIEKHIINDNEKTFDSDFSLNSEQFKQLVTLIRHAELIKGVVRYGTQSIVEDHNKRYRKSIFIVQDIKKGERLTKEKIRVIRPNFGLSPQYYEGLIGKKIKQDVERGTPLTIEMIDEF